MKKRWQRMEMKRIDENTIRVTIGVEDLDKHGITVLDLLGDHKQVESFFYSVLDEVDIEHQFENNDAVTFQVLPSRNGLELFISKDNNIIQGLNRINAEANEYQDPEQTEEKWIDYKPDSFTEYKARAKKEKREKERQAFSPSLKVEVFEFSDFNTFVDLAQILHLENGLSDLYLYKGKYYLKIELYGNDEKDNLVSNQIAIASEYGKKTKVTEDILSEYGDLLMSTSALELARHYFK